MKDLDLMIDEMAHERLTARLQENSARVKKIDIRFTSMNKKNSAERIDEIFCSHERLVRDAVKDWMAVEKASREKYQEPLHVDRKHKILGDLIREGERIFAQLSVRFKSDYERFTQSGSFDGKIMNALKAVQDVAVAELDKLTETLSRESVTDLRIRPEELSRLYVFSVQDLLEMQILEPLQEIHAMFLQGDGDAAAESIFTKIRSVLTVVGGMPKELETMGEAASLEARKEKKMRIAKAHLLFKELVFDVRGLLEQWCLRPELRNTELAGKMWDRVQGRFQEWPEWISVLENIRPLYDLVVKKER
jgi:flagellin-specific chaperone FliS